MEIKIPTPSEYELSIKKLNKIFRKNFSTLIPSLYGKDADCRKFHYYVSENEQFLGALACCPQIWHVGKHTINTAGIGMVGTDKQARGKGVMSTMLSHAVVNAKKQGIEIMTLGGNYDRYARFGFVPSGIEYTYDMHKVKRFIKTERNWEFVKLTEKSPYLEEIIALHTSQHSYVERELFYATTKKWNSNPVVILCDGKLAGYMVKRPYTGFISEICVPNHNLLEVITQYIGTKKLVDMTKVTLPATDIENNALLMNTCENFSVSSFESHAILNFKSVIYKLLDEKFNTASLAEGELILEIKESETLKIVVTAEGVSVETSEENPDFSFTYEEAVRTMFSHNPLIQCLPNQLLQSWLPLPLYILHIDTI